MVMLSSTRKGRILRFHSDAVDRNKLLVLTVEGREAISQPYRFDIELVSSDPAIDWGEVLKAPAYLGIKQAVTLQGTDKKGIGTLKIHGMLTDFVQCEKVKWVVYRAVLVPRLWRLSLNVRTRVFLDQSVPEIAKEILRGAGFEKEDYVFKLSGREYPKREYVVQYAESDLDFVSRLLEHEGIFYFFDQGEDRERVVFGDSDGAHQEISNEPVIRYQPTATSPADSSDWLEQDQVRTLACRKRIIPQEVHLGDYNYRTPSVSLKSSAQVGQEGFGLHHLYGEHIKSQEEGKELAEIRAQELSCRETVFEGVSEARAFRAGLSYHLSDHYRQAIDGEYLITEVRHRADQAIGIEKGAAPVASYENEFVSIPADRVFRPERRTPKPKISGLMNAHIDSGGSGQYAEIDDEGRYKVQLPFDLSGRSQGKASRFIRMAQPYAGGGMGMHFPLHKGTEVILAHVNGDPDRPVIVAAAPNPETGSPVTGGNHTQCKIATGGGNKITIEDLEGGERIVMASPHSSTFLSMGAPRKA